MTKHFLILVLVSNFISINAFSKSITVYNIDNSQFPIISANFFAVDSKEKQILDLNLSDFEIKEDGTSREIISVSCPPQPKPDILSTVLVTDISGSMEGYNLNLAIEAAKVWFQGMSENQSECAITAFNNKNYLIQDFTTDAVLLEEKINTLKPKGRTDYDAAFINQNAGGLIISKGGLYKRVIVFLSDGLPNFEPQTSKIIAEAKNQGVTIYTVILGLKSPQCLIDMAQQTGGLWFDNVTSIDEIKAIYSRIIKIVQGAEPCSIVWKSSIPCKIEIINVDLILNNNNLKTKFSYIPPDQSLAYLDIKPNSILFKNTAPGFQKDSIITIKAINSDFNVIHITSNNSAFAVSPADFSLKNGESTNLIVSFNPSDSGYTSAKFNVETDICNSKFYATGGYPGKRPKNPTIKLIYPNGKEEFVAGSSENITWTGIPETDTVSIKYSTDNGLIWTRITDSASNSYYKWLKVPKTPSTKCLMKVQQLSQGLDDSKVQYLGDDDLDKGNAIATDKSGNVFLTGQFSGTVDFGGKALTSSGKSDIFVAKYNFDGFLAWVQQVGGIYDDCSSALVMDPSGNIFITGYIGTNNNGSSDILVESFSKDGSKRWSDISGSNLDFHEEGRSIALDKNGNIFVTGSFSGNADFGINKIASSGSLDIFITKYLPDGSNSWVKRAGAPIFDESGEGIAVSESGYIYITGYFNSLSDFDNISMNSNGLEDIFTARYLPDGTADWVRTGGGINNDRSTGIAVDIFDNIYITGYFDDIAYFTGNGLNSAGNNDIFTAKYKFDGTLDWLKKAGGKGEDKGLGITLDGFGNLYICGYFSDKAIFQNKTISSNGLQDAFVASYNFNGDLDWIKSAGGNNNDIANKLIFDISGLTYLIGDFNGVAVFGNQKIESLGLSDIFIWSVGKEIVQEDISDDVWSIVMPKIVSHDIDLGKEYIGSKKDSIIIDFIKNIGSYKIKIDSIYFDGNDASSFELVSALTPFDLNESESKSAELLFTPYKVGIHQSKMYIFTQTDTLVQLIKGEGIDKKLEIVNNIIDFGKIFIGNKKDSLQAVTIKNISDIPLQVSNIKLNKLNDINFSILSPEKQFIIQPGDTIKLDLRFSPTIDYRTNGLIEFYFDGLGSPAEVQLFGEGDNIKPRIQSDLGIFPKSVCDNFVTNHLQIFNPGGSPLIIKEMKLYGVDSSDFMLQDNHPIEIKPDSSYDLIIKFATYSAGIKSAFLDIISNAEPDSILTINLLAKKDSVSITSSEEIVDLGVLCPNETKDTSIIITNTGTLQTSGEISSSINLILSESNFNLNINEKQKINISFKGTLNEGLINENLYINDSICGYSKNIIFKGKIEVPKIETKDVNLSGLVNQLILDKVIVKNISSRIINILNQPINTEPFNILEKQFPIAIKPNDIAEIKFSFKPSDTNVVSKEFILTFEECGKIEEIIITGKGVNGSATIIVGNSEGKTGERIEIPIILKDLKNLEYSGFTSITTDLSFNSSLLSPDFPVSSKIEGDRRTITLENIPLLNDENGILIKYPFIVGLGNSEKSNLSLSNYKSIGGDIDLKGIDGTFNLLGICIEGGKRLINSDGKVQMTTVNPNPSSGKINIELELNELCRTSLEVLDLNGKVIMTIFNKNITYFGRQTIEFSVNELESGVYYLKLQTETVIEVQKLLIAK